MQQLNLKQRTRGSKIAIEVEVPTMAESTVKLTTKDLKSLLQPITNVLPRGQKLIFKEVLELAGNASKHLKVKRITPRNLQLVIRGDEELDTLIKGIIAGGGVIPHIHKSLILTVGTSLSCGGITRLINRWLNAPSQYVLPTFDE
ncbi:uncharacterized protein LOC130496086 [Raphanus sativus]|uniref:Histone H2A n=1 Tax=Raphanus sativus TaxID=3726 RepID=A0A9W3BWX7_RAPSA|nr:uncharacterized protein LOC130496086 [Raphanus sativus]